MMQWLFFLINLSRDMRQKTKGGRMNEKEKKNPRLPAWKVWILIIVTVQLISAIQNHRIHQQMWEVLNQQGYYLIQSLELQSENNQVSRRLFDQILEYLQALR